MKRTFGWRSLAALSATTVLMMVGVPRDADACGACFSGQSESTIVNDHRMALMISQERTILWDQISYSGNPSEFAYVVPAKRGTRLEGSKETWFGALDAATRPIIMSPQGGYPGGGYPGGGNYPGGGGRGDGTNTYYSSGSGDGESGGCCSGASDSAFAGADRAGADASSASNGDSYGNASPAGNGAPRDPIDIVDQAVVGPYQTVTLRTTDPKALQKWLTKNGFAIPEIAGPIIEDYVKLGLDFIALRLRPGKDVRSMEPIRIVSPGMDTTLPMRLMQIGSGAKVGVTLWVIAEGRYKTSSNFPDAPIDFEKLIWDYAKNRSNYQELSQAAMASGDGRGFITEYAAKPNLVYTGQPIPAGMVSNPGLADAYKGSCKPTKEDPNDGGAFFDSGVGEEGDAGASDAGAPTDAGPDDGGVIEDDAGPTADAGPPPAPPPWTPKQCDDLDVALYYLAKNDVWVTRLRANLPNASLADTLRLEPYQPQVAFDNVHYARGFGTVSRVAHRPPDGHQGTFTLVLVTGAVIFRILKRRRRA
jgi:hypothetical protein